MKGRYAARGAAAVKHTTRMHETLSLDPGAVGAPTRRVDKTLTVDDPAGGPMVHRTHTPDMPGAQAKREVPKAGSSVKY